MIRSFYLRVLSGRALLVLILIIMPLPLYAAENGSDGRWLLEIDGRDQLEFGMENLAGGIVVRWRTALEFRIENGRFLRGSGRAELMPDVEPVSRPEGVFTCALNEGVFVSRSGQTFDMPHLRYRSFPMRGRVEQGEAGTRVILQPELKYPGNYLAVMYRCTTDHQQGALWLEASPRIARELGKRQNAQARVEDGRYRATVKEVKTLPPGPLLELPLQDKLELTLESEFGLRRLRYRLQRLTD